MDLTINDSKKEKWTVKSIRLSLLIFILVFNINLFAQASNESVNPEAGNAFNKGRNFILQKKYNEAVNSFKEANRIALINNSEITK